MTVKELREALSSYPDDMEVVLIDPLGGLSNRYYITDFTLETNEDNLLVIDE